MKNVAYWTSTALLALVVISGGVFQTTQLPSAVAGIVQLGYPAYFVTILGVWKVLGGVALLVPRFPRLKEWAYAGIFFDMTGAALSHLACGSAWWHVGVTIGFAALTLASWALRPQGRMLTRLQGAV